MVLDIIYCRLHYFILHYQLLDRVKGVLYTIFCIVYNLTKVPKHHEKGVTLVLSCIKNKTIQDCCNCNALTC